MKTLLDYLQRYFLDEVELLEKSGMNWSTFSDWQTSRVLPRPSYSLQVSGGIKSFFGTHEVTTARHWYPIGTLRWIGVIDSVGADETLLKSEFSKRFCAELTRLASHGISDPYHENKIALAALIDADWQHFLDGTYGVCTRQQLPEQIATKDAAIRIIDRLTDTQKKETVLINERLVLEKAVTLLDAVSMPFAPHERQKSSRHRCINIVREKYLTAT